MHGDELLEFVKGQFENLRPMLLTLVSRLSPETVWSFS